MICDCLWMANQWVIPEIIKRTICWKGMFMEVSGWHDSEIDVLFSGIVDKVLCESFVTEHHCDFFKEVPQTVLE